MFTSRKPEGERNGERGETLQSCWGSLQEHALNNLWPTRSQPSEILPPANDATLEIFNTRALEEGGFYYSFCDGLEDTQIKNNSTQSSSIWNLQSSCSPSSYYTSPVFFNTYCLSLEFCSHVCFTDKSADLLKLEQC